jgi:hypothetical protein
MQTWIARKGPVPHWQKIEIPKAARCVVAPLRRIQQQLNFLVNETIPHIAFVNAPQQSYAYRQSAGKRQYFPLLFIMETFHRRLTTQ